MLLQVISAILLVSSAELLIFSAREFRRKNASWTEKRNGQIFLFFGMAFNIFAMATMDLRNGASFFTIAIVLLAVGTMFLGIYFSIKDRKSIESLELENGAENART